MISLENQVKSLIKSVSQVYNYFNQIKEEEEDFWNEHKLEIEKDLKGVFDRISEDFFINNVQFIVSAFKGNQIHLSYLAKVMKIKLKDLKLK